MITKLLVKNFVLIDELEITFDKGLNILTGETGSGKSIIIDAIDLAFGARASKDQIKTGTSGAYIELELENNLVISREITLTSSKSRIDGVLVSQNEVQSLRKNMLDIHTQHESYSYIHPGTHIGLLDSYGQDEYGNILNTYRETFNNYKKALAELEKYRNVAQENERRVDFLKFQMQEISEAKVENPNEYDELMNERSVLVNAEELKNVAFSGYTALYGREQSITDILASIEKKLAKASEFDSRLSEIAEVISSSGINLKESSNELRNYAENIETDPHKLNLIEDRITVLDKLRKKYGPELCDVMNNLEKFELELNEINFSQEKITQLTQEVDNLKKKSQELAVQLSVSRKKLASILSELIQKELVRLEMPKAQFMVKVETGEELSINGYDNVEFLISPNTGEPLKPLAKIASGGEISRVMLAIKTIFARTDKVSTVIFDEIDTGISGKTSQAVAEALLELASSHQIICITHQPIIAAMADQHIHIRKIQDENTTRISVRILDDEARVAAIAELAGGSGTDGEAIQFAQKLLSQAENCRKTCINL
ncbi:MAG: DNA repair protein RecN [Candidatus Melainabacteria bacterium GWF2_37_15]|nr:MAG: DNA repair protein RecN [Candidatus Melainabacteria bacterium GWF2_37_15]